MLTKPPKRSDNTKAYIAMCYTGRYTDHTTGRVMKESIWRFPIPTALHDTVIERMKNEYNIDLIGHNYDPSSTLLPYQPTYINLKSTPADPAVTSSSTTSDPSSSRSSDSSSSSSSSSSSDSGEDAKSLVEDELGPEPDYVIGLENISVMSRYILYRGDTHM